MNKIPRCNWSSTTLAAVPAGVVCIPSYYKEKHAHPLQVICCHWSSSTAPQVLYVHPLPRLYILNTPPAPQAHPGVLVAPGIFLLYRRISNPNRQHMHPRHPLRVLLLIIYAGSIPGPAAEDRSRGSRCCWSFRAAGFWNSRGCLVYIIYLHNNRYCYF